MDDSKPISRREFSLHSALAISERGRHHRQLRVRQPDRPDSHTGPGPGPRIRTQTTSKELSARTTDTRLSSPTGNSRPGTCSRWTSGARRTIPTRWS